jgi:hypothetical protein
MKTTLGACALTAVLLAAPPVTRPAVAPSPGDMTKAQLHDAMRRLWTDHVAWTRLYIISAVHNLPDTKPTTDRLLQNQADIGAAVGAFYGAEAGSKLTALLRDHILIAADLVGASKAGDQAKAADASKRWYANADQISAFLSGANPKNWPLATVQGLMKTHLDQTVEEATHRIQGKYAEDVKDYDRIVEHILMMADVLTKGIVAQFPEKFGGQP